MTWGGLNNALTAWRNAIELRLGEIRGRASDGARADAAHGSNSQHQEDSDGTVDAFDMDVNLLGSSRSTGSADELRLLEAMKLDFEQDPRRRGKLWIHDREIANRDIDDYRERHYSGKSPHNEHVHWESDEAHEDDGRTWPMPNTDRLLRELGVGNPQNDDQGEDDEDDMKIDEFFASIGRATSSDPAVIVTATAADRANRDNFARALRFAAGYNAPYDMATLPAGALGRAVAAVESIASAGDAQ
jgi:hypothetical protein